ncbi:OmpW/AlkL family protein [Ketobacter alkanivorans]|uniref:Outer membrane protein OmpW n=1 Tax=Ketobacter alkanivorans TaxID=1917421 RepID=A0A2K9LGJ1_9GAMM|nr:OmpW family outer membrane protein [Ketobacter alkanivorans]AUM11478.1 outer membrane protein OmpW [Ketobacter alkanivorans]
MAVKLKASVSVLALSVAMASGSVLAYQQGDMVARAGLAMVDPDASSTPLVLNGNVVSDTSVDVDDNTQLGLTFTYMLSDDIGVEVLAATPFSHTVTAKGLGDDLDAIDLKHLPPTVSIQYFPMASDSVFQPYLGVGLNYTTFFDEKLTSDFKAVFGDGDVSLEDSFGLAFELGCDYQLSDNLVLNAAIWTIDIDTSATIKLDSGNKITTDVDIDPLVYMVGVGYKF